MENKEQYQLSETVARTFVQGITRGNKEYAQERLEKKRTMRVSTGYSWTRSNHIDDAISREIQAENMMDQINDQIATAGYFWDYLQFGLNNGENALLIVKPGRYRSFKYGSAIDQNHLTQQSIQELMAVNADIFSGEKDNGTQQLELFNILPNDLSATEQSVKNVSFSRFYMLIYTLNNESEVNSVKLMMPNPNNQTVEQIQDLSAFIGDAQLTQDEKEAIVHDQQVEIAGGSIFFGIDNDSTEENELAN
ncbi:spr1630 family ClpXP-sensitive toxin [Leuconostoc pseudomesenteroides]|uniref:spr1630 family ClpXP-sensitive toxin n=1 Tax=Leuconostoc pseudomesenteroides TaxID=33968 RepID=UPI001665E481|nr:hypothetical protein [Leuconostoc pseudomesenteroides]